MGIIGLSAYNRSKDNLADEPLKTQGDNTSTTSVRHRSATSSINNPSFKKEQLFYPNPANDFIFLNYDKNASDFTVVILDLEGKIVKNSHLSNNQSPLFIQTADLPNGVYFVKFITNNSILCSKLIILH